MFLFAISFIAGILTVLAPCVLPLLPVIVGGSIAGGSRRRTYTIIVSLALAIILFTLVLKVSTVFIDIPEAAWQYVSGVIIGLFGISMLFPDFWASLPGIGALYRGSNKLLAAGYQRGGFWGDVLMGAALGPVFASCSPTYFIILATVLPADPLLGLVYLIVYSVGLSAMLLLIAIVGEKLVNRLGVTIEPNGWFRRSIGALLIVVGILIGTGLMSSLETWLIEHGVDATRLELRLLGSNDSKGGATMLTDSFMSREMKASVYPKAPELVAPDGYINTNGQPITLESLRGKVVLLDIWTYSCINCQRTLPYLKDWYEKYHDQGLEIIGVHTPEFAFEKVQTNVERAVKEFGIRYPVVLDNQYQTWNAYGNQYWPRKYLIDIDGYVVFDHIGEGGYAETEAMIQRALHERAERLGTEMPAVAIEPDHDEPLQVGSPETYFGSARNQYLGNGTPGQPGMQTLSLPSSFAPNTLYLGGAWNIVDEYAQNTAPSAQIRFVYGAKNVYFVARAERAVRIQVTRDGGQPLGNARGADVSADGVATIQEDRLYKLIEDSAAGVHTIEIQILDPGLQAFTFTFG